MMFSIWDKQCGRHLHTGLNSNTKEQCIADGIEYYMSDGEDIVITLEKVQKWSFEDQETLLAGADLIIEEHDEQLEGD